MKTKNFFTHFPHEIIAVDEVGRGPLGGPVVIGGVRVLVPDLMTYQTLLKFLKARGVNDSKIISAEERLTILEKLGIVSTPYRNAGRMTVKELEVSYVTWEMTHEVIDQENILAASLRGMKEASLFLSQPENHPTTVLIDGNKKLRWCNEVSPFIEIPLIQGDSKSLLIGLASIIAKEKRDAFMREMHELYPQYGFNQNAGYPTAAHRKAIQIHGPCPIHRKTFKGVKEFWHGK